MELLYYTEDIAERIALARRLGHDEILVLSTRPLSDEQRRALRAHKVQLGLLITELSTARAHAKRGHYDALVGQPRRDHFESKQLTHILNPELQERPDFIHHRNSGLNQVLLKLAKARGLTLLSTLGALHKRTERQLGRLHQNLRWSKKYGVPHELVSGANHWYEQRSAHDLRALKRELLKHHPLGTRAISFKKPAVEEEH